MEIDVNSTVAVVVSVAAFLVGSSKGGLRGLGSIGTILVALVVPATVAIGLMLPLMMIADVVGLLLLRRHIDRSIAWPMIVGGLVGVALATAALTSLSARALEYIIATVVLIFTAHRVASLVGVTERPSSESLLASSYGGVGAGLAAGITSTVAHVGGPPVSIHLLARQVPPLTFAGTTVAVFVFINWLKVPGYAYAGLLDRSLMTTLAPTALLVVPGVFAGRWVTARLGSRRFETFILAGLVMGAALLILT